MIDQLSFKFTEAGSGQRILAPDADLVFYPDAFSQEESRGLFSHLIDSTPWRLETLHYKGASRPLPRLTAWYGEEGRVYTYSGIRMEPLPWTSTLLSIKARVEQIAGSTFNSGLLNLYEHQNHSVGRHSDDEPELGTDPIIASLSLGATRMFKMSHNPPRTGRPTHLSLPLTNGSLLLMRGTTQQFWKHWVPKEIAPVGPRVNITFRTIFKQLSPPPVKL